MSCPHRLSDAPPVDLLDYCTFRFYVQVAKVFGNAVGVDVVGVTHNPHNFHALQTAFF